jgi:hypothetical protein
MITIISSVVSFNLFADGTYYVSAILTVVAYLSASTFVYLLTNHKKVALQ